MSATASHPELEYRRQAKTFSLSNHESQNTLLEPWPRLEDYECCLFLTYIPYPLTHVFSVSGFNA